MDIVTLLDEGKPIRKRFYGVEAKNKYFETIAYFKNEADRDFFLAAPALLAACEATQRWLATFVDDTWDGITREEAAERAEEVIQEARAALAAARPEATR